MKVYIGSLIIASLFIVSCSKDRSNAGNNAPVLLNIPLGTISADVNGIPVIFNSNAICDTFTAPFDFWYDSYNIQITGNSLPDNKNLANYIAIQVNVVPGKTVGIGLYPQPYGDTTIITDISYDTIPIPPFASYGYLTYAGLVNIIKFDSTIQGTFSGQLILTSGIPGSIPSPTIIRNGEFNLRIQ